MEYKCKAENEVGVASCSATLQLVKSTKISKTKSRDVINKTSSLSLARQSKPNFVTRPYDITVQEGESAVFEAKLTGVGEQSEVLWYHR